VWKGAQANLLQKLIFTLKKIAFNFEQKYFFRYNLKPLIIPCISLNGSVYGKNFEDFAIFPAVSKTLAIFRVFTFFV